MGMLDSLNLAVENSFVGRYFELKERKSCLTTEMRAGTVTFLTMAYILAVNAAILTDSGGPCKPSDCTAGSGPFCVFGPAPGTEDPGYYACLLETKRSFISATAASTLLGCLLMGVLANLPLAIAPGMGINAFFTYTVVKFRGVGGMITYEEAVAACFIEGWIFILIAVTGVRGKLIQLIPKAVMLSTAGGIGMFLAFIGLQTSEGIGLIAFDSATIVTLGGCPVADRVYWTAGPLTSSAYSCAHNKMRSASLWLGIFGGLLMVMLMGRGFRGAIVGGILFVTFVSWIPHHKATYLGADSQIPGGEARKEYFKKGVSAPDISKTAVAWSFSAFGHSELWAALISFLYLDFLDATGTFYSMATFLNKYMPGFIDAKTKTFPRQTLAFTVDGFSIVIGSLMGIAPLTVFIESATGIREGGRTGLTAIMVSFYFFLSLFFTPIIASIPPYGTGPALVLVGALMMENLLDIKWSDVQEAIPAFLTIAIIPLTYSIAYGVIAGISTYLFLYLWFLIYDLATSPLTGKPVKQILRDAVPDAFKPGDGTDTPPEMLEVKPSSPDSSTRYEKEDSSVGKAKSPV